MKALLVGESWTVHETHMKGFDTFHVCRHEEECGGALARVLEREGIDTEFMPSHVAQTSFPDQVEDLAQYDAVILSDVGSNTFLLCPDTFYRGIRRPNKLRVLADYVRGGGGVVMIGGYMSFAGIDNKARYAMTPLAEVLPVEMMQCDDRIECPEGIVPVTVLPEHPLMRGIGAEQWPFFLGYNKIMVKKGAEEIAKAGNDTFMAAMECEKGRSVAFASDCAPHWGSREFMEWERYSVLFGNMVRWTAKKV